MKFEGKLEGRAVPQRAPRTDVTFDVLVHCMAGDLGGEIVNLSGSGFRLRSSKPLEVGWVVGLKVEKMPPIKAVVRWVHGIEAGGVFLEPPAL